MSNYEKDFVEKLKRNREREREKFELKEKVDARVLKSIVHEAFLPSLSCFLQSFLKETRAEDYEVSKSKLNRKVVSSAMYSPMKLFSFFHLKNDDDDDDYRRNKRMSKKKFLEMKLMRVMMS